jgi:prolyl-tRNA editing enzyme YbaK/EbsC (Cys-tRNA(Pro) deacylase)
VWAAAGTPETVFSLTFEDLIRATSGEVADVA